MTPSSRSSGRRSWLWWTVAVVFALWGVSEVGLRILTGADSKWNVRLGTDKQLDSVAGFRNRPHADAGGGLRTNEYGYRAPQDLAHAVPADALRVLYIGDSNSVIPRNSNYPMQVEEMLERELGVDVETVNAAVPGYSSQNARLLFEAEVSRFDADHAVVYVGWNDLGQFGPEGLPYKKVERGYDVSALQRLLTNVYSIRFLYAAQRVLRQQQASFYGPLSSEDTALYEAYEPFHFEENLRAILGLALQRYPHVYVGSLGTVTSDHPDDFALATAHYPTGMDKNMKKLHQLVMKYDSVVRSVAGELDVEVIDFHAAFDDPVARRTFTDSCHVNPEGARIMARLVADAIARHERAASTLPRTGAQRAQGG